MVAQLTLFSIPVPGLTVPTESHKSNPSYSYCSPWLTPLVYFLGRRLVLPTYFGRIAVSGQDNLPTRGPVILAPTHRSRWDSLILPLAVGRPVTGRDLHYMVTADEVRGIQGWFIRRLGGFAVNTRCPTISSLRHGIDLLQGGAMLVIFPEGDIFRDGTVHCLKPGLARLAVQAASLPPQPGVTVLPVSLRYSDPQVGWGTDVEVLIGAPLAVQDYLQSSSGSDRLKAAARRLTTDLSDRITHLVAHQQQTPPPPSTVGTLPQRHH